MRRTSESFSSLRSGLLDALPITSSYVLFAAIFGMLSLQTGLTAWQSVGMSVIVYAGSAQFTALSMLSEHASPLAIVLATFLLNSRHLLMGFSMSPHYQKFTKPQLNSLAFVLTDEQYAICLNRFSRHQSDVAYVTAVSLSLYFAWIVGTWFGTVAGQYIPDPASLGLGFSFTAMFIALAFYQLTSVLRILTFLGCGVLAVGLSLILPNGLHLLIAGLLSFAVGYFLPAKESEKSAVETSEAEVEPA